MPVTMGYRAGWRLNLFVRPVDATGAGAMESRAGLKCTTAIGTSTINAMKTLRFFVIVATCRNTGKTLAGALITISVAVVNEADPIITQHTPHLSEDLNELRYVILWRLLQPDLTLHAIVAQSPVGRRSHAALHARV